MPPKPSKFRVMLPGEKKSRVVYLGPRGGRYVKRDGVFISLHGLKLKGGGPPGQPIDKVADPNAIDLSKDILSNAERNAERTKAKDFRKFEVSSRVQPPLAATNIQSLQNVSKASLNLA